MWSTIGNHVSCECTLFVLFTLAVLQTTKCYSVAIHLLIWEGVLLCLLRHINHH